jgi:transposase
MMDFVEDRPTAYIDEMQQFLYDTFDELEVPLSSIKRLLKERGWSRKSVRARAQERSELLRAQWRGIAAAYDEDQLVFLDESASNERTGDRSQGWSPIGVECGISRPLKRSERWSVLPALTVDGYIEWVIFQGSITADLYLEFVVERVLPHCTPYPGPRSVIIMDNASIHKDPRLQQACNKAGVLLKFFPPYSPDYNPIEATFKDLKAWLKKNYFLFAEFEDFAKFLNFAVQQVCKRDVRGHFRTAGYVVKGGQE